jgi:hypothetical protein
MRGILERKKQNVRICGHRTKRSYSKTTLFAVVWNFQPTQT